MLLEFGLISSPLPLIYNRLAVYVGMVHIMLQVMILPLVSVMLGIDKALMSAARSMGARPLAAFWRVFFPLGLPGVRSGSLLVFVLCLGCYITLADLGGLRDTMLSTFVASQAETLFQCRSHCSLGRYPLGRCRSCARHFRARPFRYAGPPGGTGAGVLVEPATLIVHICTLSQ
ncbi:ABC transporter permease [Bradyrhizobium algeriense]|uniref:ABC transporter permease n=1 Tax=Bradyrhizobium algeriense TaxID=634784 RepID=UPI001FCE786E|nr:ABC transporter permease subunit [Bradyrhizobium algeriense]